MATMNDRFSKKSREFPREDVNIPQKSNTLHRITSGTIDCSLNSESESKLSYKQTYTIHSQVHTADNVEIMKRGTVSKNDKKNNDEDSDDYSETEQIMVPSDPSEWNSNHIHEWILWCSRTFADIRSESIAAILPSTGKELLQLTLQDWQDIGGKTGGRILAKHFAHLRLQATGVHTPDLLQENENNEETGKLNRGLVLDLSGLNRE